MHIKKTTADYIFDVFNYLFLSFLCVAALYPFIFVVFASFSDPNLMLRHNGFLLAPLGFSLDAYKAVMQNPNIGIGYKNTLIVLIGGTCLNMVVTSLAAYALSRKSLEFRGVYLKLIVFTMVFSGGLIPLYLIVRGVGLTESLWALIIPTLINTQNFIIMRTSFEAIPESLEESARIDGANDFTILIRIVLPLSTATLAVIGLYYGVYHWNAWFHASMFLRDRSMYPLQLILREILIQNDTSMMTTGAAASDFVPLGETIKYATIVVATVPILCVYPFLQKYFIKGVMIGAVKG